MLWSRSHSPCSTRTRSQTSRSSYFYGVSGWTGSIGRSRTMLLWQWVRSKSLSSSTSRSHWSGISHRNCKWFCNLPKQQGMSDLCIISLHSLQWALMFVLKSLLLSSKSAVYWASFPTRYVQPPVISFGAIFEQSSPSSPVVFILSPGSDPISDLMKLAERTGFGGDRLKFLAMGQGQEKVTSARG